MIDNRYILCISFDTLFILSVSFKTWCTQIIPNGLFTDVFLAIAYEHLMRHIRYLSL